MTEREAELEAALERCLDWLYSLELTVGHEILMDHAPNDGPSRSAMRTMVRRAPNRARCAGCGQRWFGRTVPGHECRITARTFQKEQHRKLRERIGR